MSLLDFDFWAGSWDLLTLDACGVDQLGVTSTSGVTLEAGWRQVP